MIKRILGRTGLETAALGMGCYQFTGEFHVPPEEADRILDFAMESELNYFDTAEEYGFGESEALVGRALMRHPEKKNAIVSTKVGYFLKNIELNYCSAIRKLDFDAFVDPVEIKRAVKHSMWLLQRDYLDVLMIHEFDWHIWKISRETGDGVITSALEELKKEGVVGAIGLGGWDLECATDLMKTGRFDVVLAAGGMNLLQKPMFQRLVPEAKKQNAGILVGGCFGQNNPLLIRKDREALAKLEASSKEEDRLMARKLERLYKVSDQLGVDMPELAIRYVLAFEDIHVHIPGARELSHIQSNAAAAEKGPLPADAVREIDGIQELS